MGENYCCPLVPAIRSFHLSYQVVNGLLDGLEDVGIFLEENKLLDRVFQLLK
jgi:hypothetical protein